MLGWSLAILSGLSSAQNITVYRPGVPFAPQTLPAPAAASQADQIAEAFANLGRSTTWTIVERIRLEGDSYEPEGVVRLGNDRYFLSTTETIIPPVNAPGLGFAHILLFDGQGNKIAKATYTKSGDISYHLGGIDYDGDKIWGTIAQYRPNTTARVVSFDPHTLKVTSYFQYMDHLGGIVHDTEAKQLYGLNWGSRNASKFAAPGNHAPYRNDNLAVYPFIPALKVTRVPTYFVDYQDCKFLGRPRLYGGRATLICSGLADYGATRFQLGGLAILDLETMVPLAEVPITALSDLGTVLTQNPMDVSVVDGKLRFYLVPDQHVSTVYVYEAEI